LCFVLPLWVVPTTSSVWDANEAFYVQTPREMVESGNWISPTFNGQPRLNKPPLSYWAVALLYTLSGVSLLWERVVLAAAGTASILILWRLGHRIAGPVAALGAAGILAATFRFQIVSRRLLIDGLLLTFILAGFYCFWRWFETRSRRDFLWGCAAMGLGFLTKGPVALAPAVVPAAVLLWERRRPASLPWVAGAAVFLAIAGAWPLALVVVEGPGPVRDFLFTENLGRLVSVDFGPRRGPLYYLGVFLADFFPWSLLSPVAALAWFRRGGRRTGQLLLLWMAVLLGVFSLSLNKQEYYILPAYPAAALLIAGAGLQAQPRWLRLAAAAAVILAGAMAALLARLLFADSWLPVLAVLPLPAAAWELLRARLRAAAGALCAFYLLAALLWSGPLEQYKPVAAMAQTMQELSARPPYQGARLGYYRFTAPSLRFYVDRDILELYDLDSAASCLEAGEPVLLITDVQGLEDLTLRSQTRPVILQNGRRLSANLKSMVRYLREGPGAGPLWQSVYLVGSRPLPGVDTGLGQLEDR
jgi:4-amino-4-deoxy-L-arabinose transferase-like glycosyltransferase